MAQKEVDELVVQLEGTLELTSMEQGVKMVGAVLSDQEVNKWGVWHILRSAWKELGEVVINWVRDNLFIITVQDEETAPRILDQVPWGVMKKNFSVKRWPNDLAVEEIQVHFVPIWVQIKGVPLYLCTKENARRLVETVGEFIEMEDITKARGFLRVKVMVDTENPLVTGCWLPRSGDKDTWIEFSFERLQDFCYKCGQIGHTDRECSFEGSRELVVYREHMKAKMIRDIQESPQPRMIPKSERRHAGMARNTRRAAIQGMGTPTRGDETGNVISEWVDPPMGIKH